MTIQSTWIPKDPPLTVGETVVVTRKYKFTDRVGTITKILNCHESPWMRTDRWMSDWFILELDGEEEGFLEDELERLVTE